MNPANNTVLEVHNLAVSYQAEKGWMKVVNNISFSLKRGESLGIIGESGCGKTVTSLSLMRLIARPGGRIDSGSICLNGQEIMELPTDEFRKLRGREISMIFQEPMTSLNPVLTIEKQLLEVIQNHLSLDYAAARRKAIDWLIKVGLSDPENRLSNYPHQLSGGMKQRVMIAIALACTPRILIADEPTTSLDTTIQAQILQLIKKLQEENAMSLIMITHDLGIVAQTCDHVLVMYAGRVVEEAPVGQLFKSPCHPYTYGLMKSVISVIAAEDDQLYTIPGIVPALDDLPAGCNFQNRCFCKSELCTRVEPIFRKLTATQKVACHHPINTN